MKADFLVDSFTTLTPINSFDRVSREIMDIHIVLNEYTGEVKDELRIPLKIQTHEGIKTRVSVASLFGEDFLRITWTSKMLLCDYFDGLRMSNFRRVFSWLMDKIGCDISYADFMLDSKVNDIDFAGDFFASDDEFAEIVKPFGELKGAKRFYRRGSHALEKSAINGVQLVNRRDASISAPFIKFYSKFDELSIKSEDFFKYLNLYGIEVRKDRRRVEVTLKNKEHIISVFKRLRLPYEDIGLPVLLTLSADSISRIVNHCLNRYSVCGGSVSSKKKDLKRKGILKLTPTDYLMGKLALELMRNGYTYKHCLNLFDRFPVNKRNAKSRLDDRLSVAILLIVEHEDIEGLRLLPKDAFFPA